VFAGATLAEPDVSIAVGLPSRTGTTLAFLGRMLGGRTGGVGLLRVVESVPILDRDACSGAMKSIDSRIDFPSGENTSKVISKRSLWEL